MRFLLGALGTIAAAHIVAHDFVTQSSGSASHFSQSIDHVNSATFAQRFYRSDEFVTSANPPAILYLGGEGSLNGLPGGTVSLLAKTSGARLFALEHRWYGESLPAAFTHENLMKYLSVELAIKDIFAFQKAQQETWWNASVPWVIVGGSYSGALASWTHGTQGSPFTAAWSSSGVVNSVLDFTAFDEHVNQVTAGVFGKCGTLLHALVEGLKRGNEEYPADLRKLYKADALVRDTDFFYFLADALAMSVQYGNKQLLCEAMIRYGGDSVGSVTSGEPKEKFSNLVWEFSRVVEYLWPDLSVSCFYNTDCLKNSNPSLNATQRAGVAWRWQKCGELAWLQAAPAKDALRSQCEEVFGAHGGFVNKSVAFNAQYGGKMPRTRNTVYVDASDDPWSTVSVDRAPSSSDLYVYVNCSDCGHCIDLGEMSKLPTVSAAQIKVMDFLLPFLRGQKS